MYKITNEVYLEKEGYGILNIDYLGSPFFKYIIEEEQPRLLPSIYFIHPLAKTVKVKNLNRDSSLFVQLSEELKKVLQTKGLNNENKK
ncbi:hypothetical protein BH747_09900 [Enterococcus villorum]|uniref:Uncharacterized protein n=1 Tax=Enterococcus villorum TaxID=112904 RepID=A0A1V8YJ84_9ENTE|nr:hypothetical protein [Enterococcus villorum]OQO69574.1 hypothetical protein BH747_09900 [Enterococcus villorum]OQO72674.1 hypothetical protein BH744_11200 [Enterococcus villorum]